MQDVQNYQYYDPSPRPTPEPWWRRKRTWQMTGIFAITTIVLVFVVIAAVNVLKNQKLSGDQMDLMAEAGVLESRLAADCDASDAACLDLARADAARSLGLVGACDELDGESYEDCVTLIAIDKKDPQVCDVLSGDARSNCADTPYLLKATAEMNIDLCSQISTSSTRGACVLQVTNSVVASGNCAAASLDQSLCDASRLMADAIASGDPAACVQFDESDEYLCLQSQQRADLDDDGLMAMDEKAYGTSDGTADTDADGLSDGDEVHIHATNPANADTDGDSFPDKTEIDGGYDPLK